MEIVSRNLGALPSPLWGGVGGGGPSWLMRLVRQRPPPSPALPRKGGGSRPSSRLGLDSSRRTHLPARGIALHTARVGGGAAVAAVARGGGEAALAPVRVDLDEMAAALELLHG